MKIVLDTNVLVCGLLNPFGAPGEIVRLIAEGALILCYDARIFAEYRCVLARQKFSFDPIHVSALFDQIEALGYRVTAKPLVHRLPDPFDEAFLEAAIAGQVEFLMTGNLKHFPRLKSEKVKVISPAVWLEVYRKRRS